MNPFIVHEVAMRGRLAAGRITEAVALAERDMQPVPGTALQWQVIAAVTVGEIRLRVGDIAGAAGTLTNALADAESHWLPHQGQRVIGACDGTAADDLARAGTTALARLTSRTGQLS